MRKVFGFVQRLVLLAAGLLLALNLLLAVFVLSPLWGVRALWARVTGRPYAPFVMWVDPRSGFSQVFQAAQTSRDAAGSNGQSQRQQQLGDVVDVEAKTMRD